MGERSIGERGKDPRRHRRGRLKAIQRWRDGVSIGMVVCANADAAVEAAHMHAAERDRLRDELRRLWDNPPYDVTDEELEELFVRCRPQRLRYERRFEKSWEDGSPFVKLCRLSDESYRGQISRWASEGWLSESDAERLRAVLDSGSNDSFVRVHDELERTQQGRRFQARVEYDRSGAPHPGA